VSVSAADQLPILCAWCGSTVREGPPGFASTADSLCPVCAEQLLLDHTGTRERSPAEARQALVLDLDPAWRAKAVSLARELHFATVEATSGEQALAELQRSAFDIVLMDVAINGSDGIETCASLRRTLAGTDVPILVLSEQDDAETVRRALEAGASDFASKRTCSTLLSHRFDFLLRSWKARDDLWRSQASLAIAQHVAKLGLWNCDPSRREMDLSWEAMRLLGAPRPRLTLEEFAALAGAEAANVAMALDRLLQGGAPLDLEIRLGEAEPQKALVLRGQAAPRWTGEQRLIVGSVLDVTAERAALAEVEKIARYDAATGLVRSTAFGEFVDAAAREAKDGQCVAVLAVGVAALAKIATTFGRGQRENCAVEVARRLKGMLGELESGAGTTDRRYVLARGGGSEFLVLAKDTDRAAASELAGRILPAVQHIAPVGESTVPVSAAVGIAIYPKDGLDAEALVAAAEEASDRVGSAGSEYGYYTKRLRSASVARFMTETFLRDAMATDGLRLHLQPQVLRPRGTVSGVEALLRPATPGLATPATAEIIRVAEETGLIVPLGQWALAEVSKLARAWKGCRLTVGLNLSARELPNPAFADAIIRTAEALAPHTLELEITETSLLQEQMVALERLAQVQDAGVRIAIDDFGTGYSTLRQLADLPVDTVKIDASFVRAIGTPKGETIVAGAIALARSLGMRQVAEGVETEEQAKFLMEHGCQEMQGFLFAQALPPEEFGAFLSRTGAAGHR
jgi:EAL domain-containing protein (putative c-di-GMP-specific phosphodiesterase class I)/PleD family two-component response regulator